MDDFLDQMLSATAWGDGGGMNRAAWDASGVMVDAIGQLNGLSKLSTMPLLPLVRTTESQGIGSHGRDHHQCAGSSLVEENLQHLVHKSTLSGQFEKCEPQNNMVAARSSFDESQTRGEAHVSLPTVADGTSMGGSVALQLNLGKSMSTSSQVLASIGSRRCASITGSPSLTSNSFEGDAFQQPLHSLHSSPLIAPTWNQPYVGEVPLLLSSSGQGNRDTYSLHGEEISSEAHSGKRSQDDEESLVRESDQANMTQSLLSGQGYGIQMSVTQNQPTQDVANGAVRTRVRARRGQATDPHSIAERNRRERIAERMKALQELVPDSNKTDKASMLDEIISYVKFLQTQVKCLSMCRLGGAKAAVPLLADLPSEGASNFLAATLGHANGATRSSQDGIAKAEHQVARLMDEDMSAAMQYLQSKGLCLMPISLATAISSSGVRQILSPQAAVKDIEAHDNEEKTEELTAAAAAAAAMGSHGSAVIATLASNGGTVAGNECAANPGANLHKSFRDLARNHLTAEKTNGESACLPPIQQDLE